MAVFRAAAGKILYTLIENKSIAALSNVYIQCDASRIYHPAAVHTQRLQRCWASTSVKKPKTPGTKKKYASSSSSDSDSSDSDSDSDKKKSKKETSPLGKRGDTSFWRRKMRTHHSVFDINKDGTVSWHDFEDIHKRFVDLGTFSSKQQQDFKSSLSDVWENAWGGTFDPYCFIMAEGFIGNMHHVINDKDLSKKVHLPLQYFFKAVDHDSSGEISVEEFKTFFSCLGLTPEDGIMSFQSIDTNGDGILSIDEFCTLGKEFFLSDDVTLPSKFFWGPLVD